MIASQINLSPYSGEFTSLAVETTFLKATWSDYKEIPQKTLLILGGMTIAFGLLDIATINGDTIPYRSLSFRMVVACVMLVSAIYVRRAENYFTRYHALLLFNQILIAITIYMITLEQRITMTYLIVSAIGLTLVYYQFIYNRFLFAIAAAVFTGVGTLVAALTLFEMPVDEFVGMVIFLIPLNILGIVALRSINRIRRSEYIALKNIQTAHDEKAAVVDELQAAANEIKTLEELLPICANCYKIRNDGGYWEQLEKYIQDRTDSRFSHGICPDCLLVLYPEIYARKDDDGRQKKNAGEKDSVDDDVTAA